MEVDDMITKWERALALGMRRCCDLIRHCGYRRCRNLDPKNNDSHFGDIEYYMFNRLMAGELGDGEEDENEDWW